MRSKVLVCLLALFNQPWNVFGMTVDLFAHKDKFGQSLNMDINDRECTNVPRPWVNVTMSINTHGSCMQFYDGKSCTGRIAVIQPFHTVHQMDLSLINFHNVIQSISPCGAKVPSGRFVIQSATDSSILTVSKYENQFAFVHTLPPRAFIPKAQQWEITEKAPNEYDVMPRIHETNAPVTYDAQAMKKGSFIRKVWKIESVGRGRYVFKNEWTGKCLYKSRFRTIEEHDCRAWSPNQEWVLRPLLTPPKPTPPATTDVPPEVKYQVPSRIVDQYLEQQKFLREQEEEDGKKSTYKIKNRRKKPTQRPDIFQARKQQTEPPKPQVLYSRTQPSFLRQDFRRYSQNSPNAMYMEGMYPIYEESKVEDPIFPDFLLHSMSKPQQNDQTEDQNEDHNEDQNKDQHDDQNEEENEDDAEDDDDDDDSDEKEEDDKYKAPKYAVTRKPISIPLPTGHPNFMPQKPKYDGRVKDPGFRKQQEESDEEDDEEEDDEPKTEDQVHDALLKDKLERNKRESEESNEDEEEEETFAERVQREKEARESKEISENSEEDPATTVAGFMKLLLKGVSNKISSEDREKEEMINTFERRR